MGKYSLSTSPTATAAWRARSQAIRVSGFARCATSINSRRSYCRDGSIGTGSVGRSVFEYLWRFGDCQGAAGPGATCLRSRSGISAEHETKIEQEIASRPMGWISRRHENPLRESAAGVMTASLAPARPGPPRPRTAWAHVNAPVRVELPAEGIGERPGQELDRGS